jgi:hypothetical protein
LTLLDESTVGYMTVNLQTLSISNLQFGKFKESPTGFIPFNSQSAFVVIEESAFSTLNLTSLETSPPILSIFDSIFAWESVFINGSLYVCAEIRGYVI